MIFLLFWSHFPSFWPVISSQALSSYSLLERLSFLHWIGFAPLSKIRCALLLGLFLGSLFCFIDLCPSLCRYYSLGFCCSISFEIGYTDCCNFIILFQKILAVVIPLSFHINFRIILCISTRISYWILVEIALNPHINLGRIDIFTMVSLPIHEHSISLHLCR